MLADKFWLNPDSKMIWVSENHIKTILENPVLFEYDGVNQLEKEFDSIVNFSIPENEPKIKLNDFFIEIKDESINKKFKKFENSLYDKGFVWCEYNDNSNVLSIRSSSMNFLREGIDDLKEHLDQFKEIHLHLTLETGSVLKYRLEGKNEIQFFLEEMIIPRKAKVENLNKNKNNSNIKTASNTYYKKEILGKPKVKFTEKFKNFINKLYA